MLAAALHGCGASAGAATADGPETPLQARDTQTPPSTPSGRKAPRAVASEAAAAPRPEPDPAPAPVAAHVDRAHADLDPSNDAFVGPPTSIPACEARLEAAGVQFKPARIGVGRKRDGVYTCGARQVVRFRRGPGAIRYSSPPLLTCSMALAMADFERVLQEEAQRVLGTRVVRIDHLGTYNCRTMAAYDLVSEHSFANAIDLRRFHLENGDTITVVEHFQPTDPDPDAPATAFLRTLANRLYDERIFSVVLTPFFDHLHRNHIHVDLARYRVDGTRR